MIQPIRGLATQYARGTPGFAEDCSGFCTDSPISSSTGPAIRSHVALHEIGRGCAEHADAARMGKQQEPCRMSKGIHHQQSCFHGRGTERLPGVGDRSAALLPRPH